MQDLVMILLKTKLMLVSSWLKLVLVCVCLSLNSPHQNCVMGMQLPKLDTKYSNFATEILIEGNKRTFN